MLVVVLYSCVIIYLFIIQFMIMGIVYVLMVYLLFIDSVKLSYL